MSERRVFETAFQLAARPVRRRLALRAAISGLAAGLCIGAPACALAWWLRWEAARVPIVLLASVAGVLVASILHRRRVLTDVQVALFLDKRLDAREVVSTAVSIQEDDAAAPVVLPKATEVLARPDDVRTRPRLLFLHHVLAPVALAVAVALAAAPARPSPEQQAAPPGSDVVVLESAPELDRVVEELEALSARDPEQRERLDEIAERAKKLRERLQAGAPRREVQSELSELGDSLAAESSEASRAEQRRGLEAALAALESPELSRAKQALAKDDAAALDAETERLARTTDPEARERVKKSLEKAAKAARDEGADGVAKSLEERARRLEEAGKKADALRGLSDLLKDQAGEGAERAREDFDRSGRAEDQAALAEALEKALEGLTEAERKALAEKLREMAEAGKAEDGRKLSDAEKRALAELAKKLATAEGLDELMKQLRELGKAAPPSGDADRKQHLEEARAALGSLRKRLGEGSPTGPSGTGSPTGNPAGNGGPASSGPGAGGVSEGDVAGGTGKQRTAPSPSVAASSVRTYASSKLNPGAPGDLVGVGRAAPREGETANARGRQGLGTVAADEIGGVSRSDVPEEYRDQVGRYFQP